MKNIILFGFCFIIVFAFYELFVVNITLKKKKKEILKNNPIEVEFISNICKLDTDKVNYKEFSLEKNEKDKSLNQECDIGYKLVDGKCVVNYSFKAEYDTFRDIEQVELIKEVGPEAIKELIIDGFEIRPVTKYIFQKKGPHTVYMLLDMDKIENLEGLFAGSISFA